MAASSRAGQAGRDGPALQVALHGSVDGARDLASQLGERRRVPLVGEERHQVVQRGLPVRGLRELRDQSVSRNRAASSFLPFGLGGLRGVVQREVAEGIAGREERLQRLAPALEVAVRDLGAGVQVGQPVALVEVGVLAGDDVEVEHPGRPRPRARSCSRKRGVHFSTARSLACATSRPAVERSAPPAWPVRRGRAVPSGPDHPQPARPPRRRAARPSTSSCGEGSKCLRGQASHPS